MKVSVNCADAESLSSIRRGILGRDGLVIVRFNISPAPAFVTQLLLPRVECGTVRINESEDINGTGTTKEFPAGEINGFAIKAVLRRN